MSSSPKIHRNSGEIVKACHEIHKGQPYEPQKRLDVENGFNLRHVHAGSPEKILEVIRKIVVDKIQNRGFHPVWDVQAISPTNSRSILSCDGINRILQEELNPTTREYPDRFIFREEDKVIQIKNANVKTVEGEDTFVVNGDMGRIVEIPLKGPMTVEFYDPLRVVKIPAKKNNLLLAYCVTCHRMQGSEAPVVIIPVHKNFGFFVNRSWIYTAISRAKAICFTVGQFQAIEQAIGRMDSIQRKTFLAEKIADEAIAAEDL